jgi:tetratricopeptide (TPR) repeat protein
MRLRDFVLCTCSAAAVALFASPAAHAAVTVLGQGLAQSCYEAAEYGGNPKDGVITCTIALQTEALGKNDKAATLVNRGILRSRAGDHEDALIDFNEGLSQAPQLADGYIDRGATYIAMKRYADAVNDIDKGIELGTRRPYIAYYDRSIANEALGNIRGAYEDCKKAVELRPDFTLAIERMPHFIVVHQKTDGM